LILQEVLKHPPKDKEGKTDFNALRQKVREELNKILPISSANERNKRINPTDDYMENEVDPVLRPGLREVKL
jgi:hypothetical protein